MAPRFKIRNIFNSSENQNNVAGLFKSIKDDLDNLSSEV